MADFDKSMILQGRTLGAIQRSRSIYSRIDEFGFRVFSQFDDDGIIDWLVGLLDIQPRIFVEFGVEDYTESNTRFLMQSRNWRGFIIDGSKENIRRIQEMDWFWRHELVARSSFVTAENIESLLFDMGVPIDFGLLHIDIDGMDYWVWQAIERHRPSVAIIEYNAVFGPDRAVSVPYNPQFERLAAHYSGLYAGASLRALALLAESKGYIFIGCNGAGNNAYFVRRDALKTPLRPISVSDGFVDSRFREARDASGKLVFTGGPARSEVIRGLRVYDFDRGGVVAW